jgi:hypothetical protein
MTTPVGVSATSHFNAKTRIRFYPWLSAMSTILGGFVFLQNQHRIAKAKKPIFLIDGFLIDS